MKQLLSIIVLTVVLLTACKDANQKKLSTSEEILKDVSKNPGLNKGENTFTIGTPAGWERKDTTVQNISIVFLSAPKPGDNGFKPNANVISEAMQNTTPEKYVDYNLQNMEKSMSGFKMYARGEKAWNGNTGYWIKYTHNLNGVNMDVLSYVFAKNNIAYWITCTTMQGDLDKYQPQFDEAISSFKIL